MRAILAGLGFLFCSLATAGDQAAVTTFTFVSPGCTQSRLDLRWSEENGVNVTTDHDPAHDPLAMYTCMIQVKYKDQPPSPPRKVHLKYFELQIPTLYLGGKEPKDLAGKSIDVTIENGEEADLDATFGRILVNWASTLKVTGKSSAWSYTQTVLSLSKGKCPVSDGAWLHANAQDAQAFFDNLIEDVNNARETNLQAAVDGPEHHMEKCGAEGTLCGVVYNAAQSSVLEFDLHPNSSQPFFCKSYSATEWLNKDRVMTGRAAVAAALQNTPTTTTATDATPPTQTNTTSAAAAADSHH